MMHTAHFDLKWVRAVKLHNKCVKLQKKSSGGSCHVIKTYLVFIFAGISIVGSEKTGTFLLFNCLSIGPILAPRPQCKGTGIFFEVRVR